MDYIMLDNDKWEDAGKKYKLISLNRRPESTAVELELEYNGEILHKVEAYHNIHFIDEET
jgi:hypothetical protein